MLNSRYLSIFLILVCLGLRAWTLEYPDLIDPTESRYAFVAQEMYLSGDWVVPKLPLLGDVEPYLGKPPFHFWLAAAGFSTFGMEEWVARLPSFLSLVVMCLSLICIGRLKIFSEEEMISSFLLVSCGLLFFLSGSSVVDVTLTACTTVAFTATLAISEGKIGRYKGGLVLFASLAFGFLTKGPVALVLVGLPVLIWMMLTKRYDLLRKISWPLGILVFLAMTVPWFIAAESRNPGFLKYFFVNENFERYLIKDYGDKYGTGHRYPFGTVWGMLLIGFLPWTIPLFVELWNQRAALKSRAFWRERPLILYSLLWGVSPALIFTLAKQLHVAYVLPGLPGLAIFAASIFAAASSGRKIIYNSILGGLLIFGGIGCFLYAVFWTGLSELMWVVVSVPLVVLLGMSIKFRREKTIPVIATLAVAGYCVTLASLADTIGERRSAEPILRCLAHFSLGKTPSVGVIDSNNYSLYYYSRAWREELEKPLKMTFYNSEELPKILPPDLVVRGNEWEHIKQFVPDGYHLVTRVDRWTWYSNQSAEVDPKSCPESS